MAQGGAVGDKEGINEFSKVLEEPSLSMPTDVNLKLGPDLVQESISLGSVPEPLVGGALHDPERHDGVSYLMCDSLNAIECARFVFLRRREEERHSPY